MNANEAARRTIGTDGGIHSTKIAPIRPRGRITKKLRAVGLSVELKRIGRYAVPIVVPEHS
jgi:hypothetical protein